jgi:hypothetical protein
MVVKCKYTTSMIMEGGYTLRYEPIKEEENQESDMFVIDHQCQKKNT